MNDTEQSATSGKSGSRTKLPWVLWVFLGLLIAVIAWQQLQINQLITPSSPPTEAVNQTANQSSPAQPSIETAGQPTITTRNTDPATTITNARRLIEQRARDVRQQNPEVTGQRMFEELKFVVGEDQTLLTKLTEQLILEGRIRRQFEARAAKGEINQEQLTAALKQLVDDSEVFAEDLLTLEQFDRYREVRQSWRRGRAHPHASQDE